MVSAKWCKPESGTTPISNSPAKLKNDMPTVIDMAKSLQHHQKVGHVSF